MKTERKLSRRSFMARVVGGAVAGGGALVVLNGSAGAMQASDSDSGQNADQPGHGYTGVTDNDTGNNSDRPNHGRSAPRRVQGCSDNDSGSNADAAGNGRGNGRSDSDSSDPANCGRH
jgi:hypothetical protein